jgi:hypothetical protein
MYQILTKHPPILVDISHLPPNAHILVFDPNAAGYRKALQCIEKLRKEELYRLVIPLNETSTDVGDSPAMPDFIPPAVWFKSKIVPILLKENDTRRGEDYPFETEHGELDFSLAVCHLESLAFDPDWQTGLCRAQNLLLKHKNLGEESAVCLVSCQLQMPTAKVRAQWDLLLQGTRPAMACLDEFSMLPHLLLNGSYPRPIIEVTKKILSYIETGVLPKWECDPNKSSVCTRDASGSIINPPYGVTREEFHLANLRFCTSSPTHPFRYAKEATELISKEQKWTGPLASIEEYMAWWLPNTLKYVARDVTLILDNREEFNLCKKEFIRCIFADIKFETITGTTKRCFIDENEIHKRLRITKHFGDFQEILDTTIYEISIDAIYSDIPKNFECARDVWAYYLCN